MNSQIEMLKKNSMAQYQTIAASLSRDVGVLSGGFGDFSNEVDRLVSGYARYYRQHNIRLELTDASLQTQGSGVNIERSVSFIDESQNPHVFITGRLSESFPNFKLDYFFDASENISDVRAIQMNLLYICIVFSALTAFVLYFITNAIFKPLAVVAKTSKKIANGNYGERIRIKGKGELLEMAEDFNKMADEIERQIYLLEDEAASKQQFIDNFAHEMRTPLTSIYGFAEYLHNAPLDENEVADSTQFIMKEANHMKKIANSLLQLATLRNYTLAIKEILIPRLFEDVSQTMGNMLQEKEVRFICENDVDVLNGQEDLIKSLLLNLCFNSLKSCTRGEGIIRLEAKKQGSGIELSVSDNGYGIPEESLSKITNPFYRVDKARSKEHGGAGLGLTLCKQIAEVHGAEMIIESNIKKGTTVKITFTTS